MKLVVEKSSLLSATDLVECTLVRGREFGDVWHHHPACEITLVRRGGSERWVGDTLEPLTPGDLVFLGQGLPHDYRNAPLPKRRPQRVEAVVVHFMPHLLGEAWYACATLEPLRRLFERARRGLRVSGHTRDAAEAILLRMGASHGIRRLILLLELLELLASSKQLTEISSEGFLAEPKAYSSDRIGIACAHIEQHLAARIRVPELARKLGLSESAFSRLFKKCTNSTVPQYINRFRIAHACRLLAETDKTVAEIVRLCGYLSPAHFQRQFQKHHRRTPQAYRLSLRSVTASR
jgi:AraC-like DNA-binding protein